ncbi:MAG: efflux transporter outer membrane subunit [Phycisphaerae bacterium]|nr:efflux transporter outer membrane subunit [Phycisphaerae bacterium]
MKKYKSWISLSLILYCAGCTVGPDYQAPTINMPDQWHQQLAEGFNIEDSMSAQWWELLNEPALNELVQQVRENNPDLESAYWSFVQSRYTRDYVSGEYYPSIDAAGSYSRTRASDKGLMALPNNPYNMHSIGFDASWELNIVGRFKRALESAQASYEARLENYRDVLVSLSAEAARNYVELRTIQARIGYAMQNIESQDGTLNLAQARFDSELAPRLDVEQARLNLADTQSQIPSLRSAERAAINRLCVLTGKQPGELSELLAAVKPVPMPPEEIGIQVPAELLRQRPDIRRAERELAAQTAQIGYATADLYPSFSLNGNIGFEAMDFSDVTKNGSQYYGFGPSFRWNIFDGDRIRNQIKIEESKTKQLYWQYRSTVLSALEEVENAMTSYIQERQRQQALQQSVDAAKKSVELVTTQYKNGLTDFQNVLILQRSQFQQQDKLAQSEGQVVQNLIRIYKALGGWGDDVLPQSESIEQTGQSNK